MGNRDLDSAWGYHDGTKHSLGSIRMDAHYMDFDNQPFPFKIYTDLESIPLPHDSPQSGVPALSAISAASVHPQVASVPDLGVLASILYNSAGITKRGIFPGGELLFRAAACTGALYHIELYLVCGDLPGLPAGVYHFGPRDFALSRLRSGDYRGVLAEASGGEERVAQAPVTVVCTSTYWRNSWKYQARAYRHCFWDSGTILANLLSVSGAHEVPARVVGSFVDETVNQLLGLDTQREVALGLVPLGWSPDSPAEPLETPSIKHSTLPLSKTEVDYPAIRQMHEASSLVSVEEAERWHGGMDQLAIPEPSGLVHPMDLSSDDQIPDWTIERVIGRRGSTRQFLRRPISFHQLSTILNNSTRGIPSDFLEPEGTMLNQLYLIVNDVEGLPSGSYVYHHQRDALELLQEGDHRQVAGHLGLQQALPTDASVDVFLMTDLKPVLERYGNRGYRAAQLEGGIIGGKLYLAAYAQRLGASGLTFFDDDVTTFFSPHAEGKSVMFLVALGVPLRRQVIKP